MSTWIFNVVKHLVEPVAPHSLWIAEGDSDAEDRFQHVANPVLAKCHHFSPRLITADVTIYSYRDLRTAAISARRKFGAPCDSAELAKWISNGEKWRAHADLCLKYEEVSSAPLNAIRDIRSCLADKLGSEALTKTPDSEVYRNIARAFETVGATEENLPNPDSLIFLSHRTWTPQFSAMRTEEQELYVKVEQEFPGWLAEQGYSVNEQYGQDFEYNIISKLISYLGINTAVDVGAEQGSFIHLALLNGVKSIAGFEPLPRHYERLKLRFNSNPKIEIFPLAVSNTCGDAIFHIATDPDGNELDYHHSLGELGDSLSIVRSQKRISVKTVRLDALAFNRDFTNPIELLKIDTDGHDLNVLKGLGSLRPRVIMAEYWDDLPESSGKNLYTLSDLINWGRTNGYSRAISVRRNGNLEFVDMDAAGSISKDWGNVIFIDDHEKLDDELGETIRTQCRTARLRICNHVGNLEKQLEAKESLIQRQAASIGEINLQLQEKEQVIRELSTALDQTRKAALLFRPATRLARLVNRTSTRITRSLRARIAPRLGVLVQYRARSLTKISRYRSTTAPDRLPKISIVTPSFKQGKFIERTINSVLNQSYPNLEYFVQDGGSRDETVSILNRYSEKITGWESAPDRGQSHAINIGLARTTGDIMAWLNSDDLLLPDALIYVAEFFLKNPKVDVLYGHRLMIDEQDEEIGRWILPPHNDDVLSWADYVPQETLFWRRSAWERIGGQIDDTFRFAMDWDLLLRFRNSGARIVRVPRVLGAFRIHNSQKTLTLINDAGAVEMERIRLREIGRKVDSAEILTF